MVMRMFVAVIVVVVVRMLLIMIVRVLMVMIVMLVVWSGTAAGCAHGGLLNSSCIQVGGYKPPRFQKPRRFSSIFMSY
jgi:hypothetical protein